MLKCVYSYLAQIPEQSHEDLQGVRQGVLEDVSEGVPDVQVYQRFLRRRRYLRDLKYPDIIRISNLFLIRWDSNLTR